MGAADANADVADIVADVDGSADDRDNDADDDEHHGKNPQDASHGKSGHPLNKTSTFTAEVS